MKWIRCSERLPDTEGLDGSFFVKCDNGYDEWKATAFWMDNEWADCHSPNGSSVKPNQITGWLDLEDNTDEQAAFNAARETTVPTVTFTDFLPRNQIKYLSFEDYLKSKQK